MEESFGRFGFCLWPLTCATKPKAAAALDFHKVCNCHAFKRWEHVHPLIGRSQLRTHKVNVNKFNLQWCDVIAGGCPHMHAVRALGDWMRRHLEDSREAKRHPACSFALNLTDEYPRKIFLCFYSRLFRSMEPAGVIDCAHSTLAVYKYRLHSNQSLIRRQLLAYIVYDDILWAY